MSDEGIAMLPSMADRICPTCRMPILHLAWVFDWQGFVHHRVCAERAGVRLPSSVAAVTFEVPVAPDPRDARIAELEAEVARLRGEVKRWEAGEELSAADEVRSRWVLIGPCVCAQPPDHMLAECPRLAQQVAIPRHLRDDCFASSLVTAYQRRHEAVRAARLAEQDRDALALLLVAALDSLRRMHRRAQAAERALRVALRVGRDECRQVRTRFRECCTDWMKACARLGEARADRDDARALLALALEHGGEECARLRADLSASQDAHVETHMELAERRGERDRARLACDAARELAENYREGYADLRAKARALLGAFADCGAGAELTVCAVDGCGALATVFVDPDRDTHWEFRCDAHDVAHEKREDLPHAAALRALAAALEG
jgi:hypothetical protein